MSPYKEYRGDFDSDFEPYIDDEEEIECSVEGCNKPAERNGYCKECNAEMKRFIDCFRTLSDKCKTEVRDKAFDPEWWDL